MSADDTRVLVAQALERIGAVDQRAASAHGRIDILEQNLRQDLGKIFDAVDPLKAYMNRGQGWAAASILGASIFGGLVATVIGLFLK